MHNFRFTLISRIWIWKRIENGWSVQSVIYYYNQAKTVYWLSINQELAAINLALAHSGQRISAASVMKPLPTSDVEHWAQMKQSLCQCRSSNEINLAPPIPVNWNLISSVPTNIHSFSFTLLFTYCFNEKIGNSKMTKPTAYNFSEFQTLSYFYRNERGKWPQRF